MLFRPATKNRRLILLLLWLLVYATVTLWLPPLLDDADSVHAEVAREMLLRHDWLTLYANGIRYLEKAPILYWSMALSFRIFGVSTAAARLPIALTVLALALLLESFAHRAFPGQRSPLEPEHQPGQEADAAQAGLYAGLILLSSFGIFIFTRITIPDADVCLWLTFALFAFWTTEQPGPVPLRACLLFAAACALNVLTKGLIGIVFPLAIVLAYLLLTRRLAGTARRLRQLHPWSSLTVFLALAAPWHILIGLANPTQGHPAPIAFVNHHWLVPEPTGGNVHGWFWFYFVNEHLLRYLNLRVPRDYDTVPLPLFLGLILVWLIPWSAFLYPALKRISLLTTLKRHPPALSPLHKTNLLLALWAAIPLLFFSLSTRQEYYVLPALPALILLLAQWLSLESDPASHPHTRTAASRANRHIAAALLILGALTAIAILVFLLHTAAPTRDTDLATLLQQNPADYALSFGHFLDLNAHALGLFRLPLALTAVAAFAGPLAHWLLRRRGRPHAATLALAAATFLFLFAAHLGLRTFAPVLTSKQLADSIAPQLRPEDLIVLHGEYESGSTLGFYLQRADLHILEGRSSNLWYGSFFPDAPPIFETRASLAAQWPGPRRIFLWEDPSDRDRPPLHVPNTFLIAHSGGKQLLSNQPNR